MVSYSYRKKSNVNFPVHLKRELEDNQAIDIVVDIMKTYLARVLAWKVTDEAFERKSSTLFEKTMGEVDVKMR